MFLFQSLNQLLNIDKINIISFFNSGDLYFGDFENWGDGAEFHFNNYIYPIEDKEIKKRNI